MKLKGTWDPETTYAIGDVVVYPVDNVVYHLQKLCHAGTTPFDSLYWRRLGQEAGEIVIMMMDLFEELFNRIPSNINDESIVLSGTEGRDYIITVDDSGDTPELAVDLIETEEGDDA